MDLAMTSQRDPGGKFTLFSILTLSLAVLVGAAGAALGGMLWWPLGIVGGLAGVIVGAAAGNGLGDYNIIRLVRKLNTLDTPALYAKLKAEPYLAHLVVLVLAQRGEPKAALIGHGLDMLMNDNEDVRWQGWRALSLNYPDVKEALGDIDPKGSPAAYRDRVEAVRTNYSIEMERNERVD